MLKLFCSRDPEHTVLENEAEGVKKGCMHDTEDHSIYRMIITADYTYDKLERQG